MRDTKRLNTFTNHLWHEWLKPAFLAVAIVAPIKSAIADWNWVPSGSMKPTIMEGDLVAINKLAYDFKVPFTLVRLAEWSQPANGDIVVFFSPKDGTRLVKRVIASPGDTIEMRNNILFRNGERLRYTISDSHAFPREIYEDLHPVVAKENDGSTTHWVMALPSRRAVRDFSPVTVPPGKYFMMGDSRDNSFDSRFFGVVDGKQIVGRASRVILSFDRNHYYVPRIRRSFSSLDQG
jgi:signal peptidase I